MLRNNFGANLIKTLSESGVRGFVNFVFTTISSINVFLFALDM